MCFSVVIIVLTIAHTILSLIFFSYPFVETFNDKNIFVC